MTSSERAFNEALASLARDRKLEDFDLGLLETKKAGWREVPIFACLFGRWLLWLGASADGELACLADGGCFLRTLATLGSLFDLFGEIIVLVDGREQAATLVGEGKESFLSCSEGAGLDGIVELAFPESEPTDSFRWILSFSSRLSISFRIRVLSFEIKQAAASCSTAASCSSAAS